MVDLVTDACFVVHARGLRVRGAAYFEFLDELAAQPTYRLTNTVRTEAVRHGAADWVNDLQATGRLVAAQSSHTSAAREQARLRKVHRGNTPGVHDIGLLRLARDQGLSLLTDDHALYHVAQGERLSVLDVFDVLLAGVGAGLLTESDIADTLSYLNGPTPHYEPTGWKRLRETRRLDWPDDLRELAARRRQPDELLALIRPGQ